MQFASFFISINCNENILIVSIHRIIRRPFKKHFSGKQLLTSENGRLQLVVLESTMRPILSSSFLCWFLTGMFNKLATKIPANSLTQPGGPAVRITIDQSITLENDSLYDFPHLYTMASQLSWWKNYWKSVWQWHTLFCSSSVGSSSRTNKSTRWQLKTQLFHSQILSIFTNCITK